MKTLHDYLPGLLLEALGRPARVARAIRDHGSLCTPLADPARCVQRDQVPAWHEWPSDSWSKPDEIILNGWRPEADRFASFHQRVAALANFVICEAHEHWHCDIQAVEGLSNSKSDLRLYATLDEFIQTQRPGMLEPISENTLRERLAHKEIRILHQQESSDSFVRYLWDGRVFLRQSGGSHNFAAARFLASRLGRAVALRGRLHEHSINRAAVAALRRDYAMAVLGGDDEAHNAFHDALGRFRASYLWCALPRPYRDMRVFFLPWSDARSLAVTTLLNQSGFTDLGAHFEGLLARQAAAPTSAQLSQECPQPGRLRVVSSSPT